MAQGFCLPVLKTMQSNFKNKHRFTPEVQKLRDRITELEDEIAALTDKPQRKNDSCFAK